MPGVIFAVQPRKFHKSETVQPPNLPDIAPPPLATSQSPPNCSDPSGLILKSRKRCFENFTMSSRAKIEVDATRISKAMRELHDGLGMALKFLLLNEEFSDHLHDMIRTVMQQQLAASTENRLSLSFLINLSAVLLRLCAPFCASLRIGEINHYDISSSVFSRNDQSICATFAEFQDWVKHAEDNQEERFFSKMYFLTVRVLNLGIIKAISESVRLGKDIVKEKEFLCTPSLRAKDLQSHKKKLERLLQLEQWFKTLLFQDLQAAMSFYRFMIVWLAELVGGFTMPLPVTCPREFSVVPDYFVTDTLTVLEYTSNCAACDCIPTIEYMNFMVLFLADRDYIRELAIRSRMITVLNMWSRSPAKAVVFKSCKLATVHLVRNLLKVYGEVNVYRINDELGQRHTIRDKVAKLLQCLCGMRCYEKALQEVSMEEDGVYSDFLHFVLTDTLFFLTKILEKVQAIKSVEDSVETLETLLRGLEIYTEVLKEDEKKLIQLKVKQKEPERKLTGELIMTKVKLRRQLEHVWRCRVDLFKTALQNLVQKQKDTQNWIYFLNEHLLLLESHSKVAPGPFLDLYQIEILTKIIKKVLLELVGRSRRTNYILKDPHTCGFQWRELVKQIVLISVQLFREDGTGIFHSVMRSEMSSHQDEILEAFQTAAKRVRKQYEDPEILDEFIKLINITEAAGEVTEDPTPQEYLDNITHRLMKDPVKFPETDAIIDRETLNVLLSQGMMNPYNQLELKAEDMIEQPELKERIAEYNRQRQRNRP